DAFRACDEQLVLALVVAVKEDAVAWEVGARRGVQLAARHDVEAKPYFGEQPQQPRRAVRLGRIADRRAPGIRRHRVAERAGTRADRRLVVDIQRRSVLRSERDEIAPAHRERVARRETRRVGAEPGGEGRGSDGMAGIASPISAAGRGPNTPAVTPAREDWARGGGRH